ncbi:hypothetical protein ALC60_04671 [Trachymyrmex zeteki]|uniref:Uncharacterized protein n=1 Tax=Mycetomoellerius zeteki TaxID=64791 RepID=A0A151X7Y7_9HYME|nr:hypothetical protein ALC60_04671 [Trachymyrmex zeteki]
MTDLEERPQKQTRRYPWSFLPRAELHSLRRRRRRRRRHRRHCRNGSLGGMSETLACKRYRSWGNTFLMPEDLDGTKIGDFISLVHGTGLSWTA